MSASRPNGQSTSEAGTTPLVPGNLQADIALLRSLLKDETPIGNDENVDELNLDELLQRLETADGIARGVEGRLDDIIDNLDGLLESLEAQATGGRRGLVVEEMVAVVECKNDSTDDAGGETSEADDAKESSK